VISQLLKLGHVYLLSGDNAKNVNYVAEKLGIPLQNVIAKASPEQKVEFIKSLDKCAMIGDGANDAVAMSQAEIGIAVKGSMAASLKAANVYFTVDGIEHMQNLLNISALFTKTVRGHMWFSALYNSIGAVAALAGFINPLIAALLMPASSLTVLITSLWGMKSLETTKNPEKILKAELRI
ncbi:MAG: HAD-IC family P-type ATPase, partial [Bdellovibrionales bacterium]|nr:HAD-IC family P-type ATPase [Bdellovibrionales bacterium]